MPEAKGAHGPSGPTNQPSPRSGVLIGNGRGSGPGMTSSSAFGSVAQEPAGRVGCGGTRGPWNTVARICRESPLGRNRRSVRRRTRPDRRVAVRPQTIAIRKNRQGACRLAQPPLSVSGGAAFGIVRTPPTRPSDRHPQGPLTRAKATMIQSLCIGSERQDTCYWIRKNGT